MNPLPPACKAGALPDELQPHEEAGGCEQSAISILLHGAGGALLDFAPPYYDFPVERERQSVKGKTKGLVVVETGPYTRSRQSTLTAE